MYDCCTDTPNIDRSIASSKTASTSIPKYFKVTGLHYKDENLRRICTKVRNTEVSKPCDEVRGLMAMKIKTHEFSCLIKHENLTHEI